VWGSFKTQIFHHTYSVMHAYVCVYMYVHADKDPIFSDSTRMYACSNLGREWFLMCAYCTHIRMYVYLHIFKCAHLFLYAEIQGGDGGAA